MALERAVSTTTFTTDNLVTTTFDSVTAGDRAYLTLPSTPKSTQSLRHVPSKQRLLDKSVSNPVVYSPSGKSNKNRFHKPLDKTVSNHTVVSGSSNTAFSQTAWPSSDSLSKKKRRRAPLKDKSPSSNVQSTPGRTWIPGRHKRSDNRDRKFHNSRSASHDNVFERLDNEDRHGNSNSYVRNSKFEVVRVRDEDTENVFYENTSFKNSSNRKHSHQIDDKNTRHQSHDYQNHHQHQQHYHRKREHNQSENYDLSYNKNSSGLKSSASKARYKKKDTRSKSADKSHTSCSFSLFHLFRKSKHPKEKRREDRSPSGDRSSFEKTFATSLEFNSVDQSEFSHQQNQRCSPHTERQSWSSWHRQSTSSSHKERSSSAADRAPPSPNSTSKAHARPEDLSRSRPSRDIDLNQKSQFENRGRSQSPDQSRVTKRNVHKSSSAPPPKQKNSDNSQTQTHRRSSVTPRESSETPNKSKVTRNKRSKEVEESSGRKSSKSKSHADTKPGGQFFNPDADLRVINDSEDFVFCPKVDMSGLLHLSFCGCGFLGMYHLGVVSCLIHRGPSFLAKVDKVGGASAGALMGAVLITARDRTGEVAELLQTLAKEIRNKPLGALTPGYSFTYSLRRMLDEIIPENGHVLATGKLHISLTNAKTHKNQMISDFTSRDELIESLVATCYIPVYAGMKFPTIRGQKYMDGGLSDNLPCFDEGRSVTVSPFDGKTDISPKQGQETEKKAHFVSVHNQEIQVCMKNLKRGAHAFFPPRRGVLQEYFEKGRFDASRFLIREGFYEINGKGKSKRVMYESTV